MTNEIETPEEFVKDEGQNSETYESIITRPTGGGRWHAHLPESERRKFIEHFIFDKKAFVDRMIDDPKHPECKNILKAIITVWGSGKYQDLSVETALVIICKMEPIESYDFVERKNSPESIVVKYNWYDIEEFLKKVDEHMSSLQ